jgi:hypothetical protein
MILPPEAKFEERTVEAIAARAVLTVDETLRTLRQLESLEPPVVHRDTDATLGIEFWIAMEPGASDLVDPPEA